MLLSGQLNAAYRDVHAVVQELAGRSISYPRDPIAQVLKMATASEGSASSIQLPSRLVSLDALRGFVMFWILGADSLVQGLRQVSHSRPVQVLADQLEHVGWEGFHFYDLIFPLFVFLMGTSAVYSLEKIVQQSGRSAAYRRLFTRSLLLYLFGLFYYGGLSRGGGPEMFRYVGVLQRIAVCYFVAGLIVLNFRWRGILAWCAGLLVAYWLALTFVTVSEYGAGNFEEGKNLTNYIDSVALPGYKWDGDWDPEGLLSHIPAIGTALLGALAGAVLRRDGWGSMKKVGLLAAVGLVCLLSGYLWGLQFPIIKKIWTSSYVLVAGGWSYLLLAFFYLIVDVVGFGIWTHPFVWIGTNCITIYMLANIIDFRGLLERVIHAETVTAMGNYGPLVMSLLSLAIAILICQQLYKRKIFLRL